MDTFGAWEMDTCGNLDVPREGRSGTLAGEGTGASGTSGRSGPESPGRPGGGDWGGYELKVFQKLSAIITTFGPEPL